MSGLAGGVSKVLALAAGVALATVAFDFLGVLALIGESVLLVIAARVRSPTAALIVGGGAAVFLLLVVRVLALCDSTNQDCSIEAETVVFMAWLGVLAIAGVVTAVIVRRSRTP